MGLMSWAKNKAKQTITNIKNERAENKEQQRLRREQYNKGYIEGQYKKGVAEGSGKTTSNQTVGRARWQPDWSSAGKYYSGGGGTSADVWGFGSNAEKHQAPQPSRITNIGHNGQVTVIEHKEPIVRKGQSEYDDVFGSPFGGSVEDFWGETGNVKKRKRDPYDYIL